MFVVIIIKWWVWQLNCTRAQNLICTIQANSLKVKVTIHNGELIKQYLNTSKIYVTQESIGSDAIKATEPVRIATVQKVSS